MAEAVKKVGDMNAAELHAHIKAKEEQHRKDMKHLRSLLRCLDGGAELLEKKAQ